MPILLAPCRVQGEGSAGSIVAALRRLYAHPSVEVIICGRGGGSLDDLWSFNDESVVRTLAASPVPTISAVGHETDWTLCDLVADQRAKTPTAAAEIAVPVEQDLLDRLAEGRRRLQRGIEDLMMTTRQRLQSLRLHRALAEPGSAVERLRQRHDELRARLSAAVARPLTAAKAGLELRSTRLAAQRPQERLRRNAERLQRLREHLERRFEVRMQDVVQRHAQGAGRLHLLSPLAVIGRGYAVLKTSTGVVRQRADAPIGSSVSARVVDGWIDLAVTGGHAQRLDEPAVPYRP